MLKRLSTLLGSIPAMRSMSMAMMGEFNREGIVEAAEGVRMC